MINRHTAYKFKNGTSSQNRVVVPPMASQTADKEGFVTEDTVKHYCRLAQSRAGLIFVEYSYVHPTGKGEDNQLGIYTDAHIPGLKKISSAIHLSSALAALQLVHVGGKTSTELTRAPLMAPSAIPVPVKGWQPETPTAMTPEQIHEWVDWFVTAAGRAEGANFDIVELHAAHGYGLNQWLSPITNKRQDSFGGSIEGRSRLLLQIATKIKTTHPKLLLAVRLPAQDHMDGGLTVQEMAWVVSQLELVGTDIIDVSSGIGGWRRPNGRMGQGYLISDAEELKSHISIPVIGVGGIETGSFIDQILEAKKIDFAAVGRAILQDPANWGLNNLARDSSEASVAI